MLSLIDSSVLLSNSFKTLKCAGKWRITLQAQASFNTKWFLLLVPTWNLQLLWCQLQLDDLA